MKKPTFSDVQLVEILLEFSVKKKFKFLKLHGLCFNAFWIRTNGDITSKDYSRLNNLIQMLRPESDRTDEFFWPPGQYKPRIEALKRLLEKLKNAERV